MRAHGDKWRWWGVLIEKNRDSIDLNDNELAGCFGCAHHWEEADDLGALRLFIINYDVVIIATPLYWYSIRGIKKGFFSRIFDL